MFLLDRHRKKVVFTYFWLCFSLVIAAVAAEHDDEVLLVDEGEARAVLVLPDSPTGSDREAAGELQTHLKKAAGIEMEEVDPDALPDVISPEDFKAALAAGDIALVDVRSEREFAEGNIEGAINIPDGEFYDDPEGTIARLPNDRRVVFICATGARSAGAFFMVSDILYDEPELYDNPHGIQYLDNNIEFHNGDFTIK